MCLLGFNYFPSAAGDIQRPELLKGMHVDRALACVLTLTDMASTNKAVVGVRKLFPRLPIIARAKSVQHKQRLENMFGTCVCVFLVLSLSFLSLVAL